MVADDIEQFLLGKSANASAADEGKAVKIAMKALKEYAGLDPAKYSAEIAMIGERLGFHRAKLMKSESEVDLADKITSFWLDNNLGEMKINKRDPLVLEVNDCCDCLGWMTGVGVPCCPFKEGFLKGVFEAVLKRKYHVAEITCCGTFAPSCRFEVTT